MLISEPHARIAPRIAERNSSIRLAQRSESETPFQFTTRIYGEYFDLDMKSVRYFARQVAMTLDVSPANIPARIRLMSHFFEVSPTETVSFLRLFRQYHRNP